MASPGQALGDAFHILEHGATDAVALPVRVDRHRRQIEWPLTLAEVLLVDRPRLLRGQLESADDCSPVPDDEHPRVAQGVEDALLGHRR